MIGEGKLRRKLGLSAVAAIVIGDMLGSGIFFTPGELASVAQSAWQIYFIWTVCGFITLCGALTLAELATVFPRAGSTYHIIRTGFGPFWAFLKIWIEMWVSGPGSIAGVAFVFGQFASQLIGISPILAGILAILFFTTINLLGVQWGGQTQTMLTGFKITALIVLIAGSLLVDPVPVSATPSSPFDLFGFFRSLGLGIAAVLFTYDGWIDVTHVAGEVKEPQRNLPAGLVLGVGLIVFIYLLTNFAFLRIVPIGEMQQAPTMIAATVATRTLGSQGGTMLNILITISILGALGGLVMTLPRLFYAAAAEYSDRAFLFRVLASVSSRTAVPWMSILFTGAAAIVALLLFQSFSRLVNFLVVPLQLTSILAVATIFKIRNSNGYRTPGFPVVPLIFIIVLAIFMASAAIFKTKEAAVGILLAMTAIPVYFWIEKRGRR